MDKARRETRISPILVEEGDDGRGGGAAVREGVHVGHDVVPQLALLVGRHGEVDVVHVALHLDHLRLADGQAQLLRGGAGRLERERGRERERERQRETETERERER